MKYVYKKVLKIKYNNKLFQVLMRDDEKYGFLRIINQDNKDKYVYPTAQEFLHLNSVMNPQNRIHF